MSSLVAILAPDHWETVRYRAECAETPPEQYLNEAILLGGVVMDRFRINSALETDTDLARIEFSSARILDITTITIDSIRNRIASLCEAPDREVTDIDQDTAKDLLDSLIGDNVEVSLDRQTLESFLFNTMASDIATSIYASWCMSLRKFYDETLDGNSGLFITDARYDHMSRVSIPTP